MRGQMVFCLRSGTDVTEINANRNGPSTADHMLITLHERCCSGLEAMAGRIEKQQNTTRSDIVRRGVGSDMGK